MDNETEEPFENYETNWTLLESEHSDKIIELYISLNTTFPYLFQNVNSVIFIKLFAQDLKIDCIDYIKFKQFVKQNSVEIDESFEFVDNFISYKSWQLFCYHMNR